MVISQALKQWIKLQKQLKARNAAKAIKGNLKPYPMTTDFAQRLGYKNIKEVKYNAFNQPIPKGYHGRNLDAKLAKMKKKKK